MVGTDVMCISQNVIYTVDIQCLKQLFNKIVVILTEVKRNAPLLWAGRDLSGISSP